MRKALSVMLTCVMAASTLAACSGNNNTNTNTKGASASAPPTETSKPALLNDTGFPIVNEPITMSAMVMLSPAQPTDWNEIRVWQKYEEMTGIHMEWDEYTSADMTEKRNLALASNELPDVFFRTKMPDSDVDKYGADGSLMRLNELIDQYAPNFKAVMEKYPDIRKGLETAEGNIYAMPSLTDSPSIEIWRKLFLNRSWLDKAGMSMPKTTEELYETLKAFRDGDMNGNGQADEVPFTADSLDEAIHVLRGAFGLGNRGMGNGNWDVDPESGELRFFPISDAYKELLTFMNKLYTEKLLDQEIFTNTGAKVLALNEQNQVGAFSFGNVIARANTNADDYAGLDQALIGPAGEQLYTSARGHFGSKGAFMISSSNPHPEAAMRWIDYFYSEEGIRMLYLGIEGESYGKNADGHYDFLPELVNEIPEGSSFDQVVSKYVPYAGGSLPTLILEDYFKGGETQPSAKEAAEKLRPYLPDELWSPFGFTAAEAEEKLAMESDIYPMVAQRTAEFVMGKASLDEFDDYVKQIERMGLDRLREIYTAAYERYTK
ncbi:extracellular solute-binding protein [Paenibacillus sp. PL2-23]|uniref:extracellular solute-binding protein n=1 Tax=Paenibacillus sp. PL2-23 TaxID=2100729 RepID=UPI0030F64A5A